MSLSNSPASLLEGLSLRDGWRVQTPCSIHDSGEAAFSCCYFSVREDGTHGFLKALDLTKVRFNPQRGWVDQISDYLNAYRYERDLHLQCNSRRLSRIVTVLSHGEIDIEGATFSVPYLIFELADGDVRGRLEQMQDFDLAWLLRVLHHTTTALRQLHNIQVAHRDIKAGNVLTRKGGEEMLLGDLGSALQLGASTRHENTDTPGTRTYAAPEQLYGVALGDWEMRRAADLYQLGSLAVYLFTERSLTSIIRELLPKDMVWGRWNGGDYQVVLPYLRSAFAEGLEEVQCEIGRKIDRPDLAAPILRAIHELCDPDPRLRGRPKLRNQAVSQYLLEPYESLFNRLAWHARNGRQRALQRP